MSSRLDCIFSSPQLEKRQISRLSSASSLISPIRSPLQDRKNLYKTIKQQATMLEQRKKLLDSYRRRNTQMHEICEKLSLELQIPNPSKASASVDSVSENPQQKDEEEIIPDFVPVEQAFGSEIKQLKAEALSLKNHIKDLLDLITNFEGDEFDCSEIDTDEKCILTDISRSLNTEVKESTDILQESNISTQINPIPPQPENSLVRAAREFQYPDLKGDYRVSNCFNSGGFALLDTEVRDKLRRVAKEIICQMGRKILNGDFNLTRVSFPIKCMQGNTALHNCMKSTCMSPLYLTRAGFSSDPIERMKLVITSSLSSFVYTSTFLKPLNPVLGETLYGEFEDGTELYCEQTFHHPPISHFLILGPSKLYRMYGYFNFSARASLNSVTINNSGYKTIEFPDGHIITHDCTDEVFNGTFFGSLRHESLGVSTYKDNYGNRCTIKIGGIKGKPSDFLEGEIIGHHGEVLSKVTGTYAGYLDFDRIRYWDARQTKGFPIHFRTLLPSDSEARTDLLFLRLGDMDAAQQAKEDIENLQRTDRKLREIHGPSKH